MRRQDGAGGAFIAVVIALVALLILAVVSLTRTTTGSAEREQGVTKLNVSASALDSYAGVSLRLPCPANPATDDGVEVTNGAASCQFPDGTLPWKTIGMRREDSLDAWGRKISYRVYTGNAGSLTQPGGASMANCDVNEAFPGGTTPTGGGSGGLCKPVPNTSNAADRTTTPAQFLAGKGLTVTDFGAARSDVAYVLISHGITGLGGYTASGVRLDMPPNGDERDNTRATGPFTNRAFSNPDTGATAPANAHFDDLVVYRGIEDLAKRANIAARNWPDTILSAVTFDRNTLAGALGGSPGADTGRDTIAFNNATVRGFDSGGAQNVSFVSGGGSQDGIGGVSGGDGLLGSAGGEFLQIDFAESARQFAFTVDKFDDAASVHEQVELRFIDVVNNVATTKATVVKSSCASNGKVTSFSMDACVAFNRVEIRPLTMSDNTSPSAFSLNEIRTCVDGVTCETALKPGGNVCSTKVFSPCSIGVNDTSQLKITLANNGGGAMTSVNFADTYPALLVNTAAAATTCGGAVAATTAPNGLTLSGGTVPGNGSCTVTVNVTSTTPNTYANSTGSITTASSGTLAPATGSLIALAHPVVSIAFNPPTVAATLPSLLTITFTNSNTQPITRLAVGGPLPAGLTLHQPVTLGNTCGGSLTNSGDTITFLDGTIPAGATCTISTSVTSMSPGTYVLFLPPGTVTSGNAGANAVGASASLVVN